MLQYVRNAEQGKQQEGREKLDLPGRKEKRQGGEEWVHLALQRVHVRDQAWRDELGFLWKGTCSVEVGSLGLGKWQRVTPVQPWR